jgi:hypothetical protein
VKKRLTRLEIQDAVRCPNWQDLRRTLKGVTTERKVKLLQYYIEYRQPGECCLPKTREVQVVNYLTALSRGGLIDVLPDEFTWDDIGVRR